MNLPQDFDFTQSKLQDYVDCPYRFYMRYILQTKWPALMVDDALEFEKRGQAGARFHRLIQQFLLGMPESRLHELATADPDPQMVRWWEDFLTYVPPLLEGDRFVEILLTTHLVGQRLLAKYDLILAGKDGKLTIFDWKTSKRKPRKDWLMARLQTQLYCYILAQAGSTLLKHSPVKPEQITMTYWFTASPETPVSLPYNSSIFNTDQKYITNLISEILKKEQGDFVRTSNLSKCRYCVYRSHCDRGVEAGDLESFEEFEMEPEDFMVDFDFETIEEIKF
jgi:CRISPR/Cas system-associated exonuclease Cas4 (RecB family)